MAGRAKEMKQIPDNALGAHKWFVLMAVVTAAAAVLFSGLPGRITETFDGIVASF